VCGNGMSWTLDGTEIALADVRTASPRVNFDSRPAYTSLEGYYGPNGAQCINRPRYSTAIESGGFAPPYTLPCLDQTRPNAVPPCPSGGLPPSGTAPVIRIDSPRNTWAFNARDQWL
jgi:hypothetical protein